VPFSKPKPARNPLQRLSDQRRSLALAGLAAGAVFSAAVFRRKRRGVQDELRAPVPVVERPAAVGPIAAAAAGPMSADADPDAETEVAETAINAPEPTNQPPASEPATGELSAEEASILAVLAQSGRTDDDRTALAVATSLERQTTDVAGVLRKLGAEGVVSGELYTATGDKIWAVTERGVRRLGAQS
jgi:hypothetical protein